MKKNERKLEQQKREKQNAQKMKHIFLITFDMDTNGMSDKFGESKYRRAYRIMENYFTEMELKKHPEHSVYITQTPMYEADIVDIVNLFGATYPFISDYFKDIRYAFVSEMYSLNFSVKKISSKRIEKILSQTNKKLTTAQMFKPIDKLFKDISDDL